MAELNRYWAEEALGEPYAPQDYTWMRSTYRTGLLLGGVTCALTTSLLLGAGIYHLVDPAPSVRISSFEVETIVAQHVPASLPAAPATSAGPVPIPDALPPTMNGRSARTAAIKPEKTASPRSTAPAPAAARTQLAAVAAAPAPAPAPAEAMDRVRPATPTPAPARLAQLKPTDVPLAAKPEPDTRIGLSKAADSKPADIASGEKLGIREILPDGIVMQNGKRVKNGSALPNGEILMGTDASKGMAETDRRVLVLTP